MGIDTSDAHVPGNFEAMWKVMLAELRIRPIEFAVDPFNFLVGLWFFIWLGFLRGTVGPNPYGADPVQGE